MTELEVAELFIKAAHIDSLLPINAAPQKLKGASFQKVPLTYGDQRKWFVREETDRGPSKLLKGDDPIKDWWLEFWDGRTADMSRNDVMVWERANDLIRLVANQDNRRALWAWARAKVGSLESAVNRTRIPTKPIRDVQGDKTIKVRLKIHKRTQRDVSFAAWCRSEGISEMTGSRRKGRAIAIISQHLVRGASPDYETPHFEVLPIGVKFEHISDNIAIDAPDHKGPTFERDRETVFAKEAALFDWREFRNQRRRQREAKKREKQAA
jgi:hypothetical protein